VAIVDPIKVTGLVEFQRTLRALDAGLPRMMRLANNAAAQIVVDWAAPRVPRRSGKAGGSVRATSGQREARVTGGGKRVPYYPWLDFGGKVGRGRRVVRPFLPDGRFIYPGYTRNKDKVADALTAAMVQVAAEAGLTVQP
jgi:hypothetical protein